MKKIIVLIAVAAIIFVGIRCGQKKSEKPEGESVITGTVSVLVDETLLPIIEDEVAVFESAYNAKINIVPKSETEAIQAFVEDSSRILIISRKLNADESKFFTSRERYPRTTQFATDAIALIGNKSQNDSVISLSDVISFMKGNKTGTIKGMVFDNPNSGTVQYMNKLAGIKSIPENGVYSFKTNAEVIKFVSENPGMIGVVGMNWILQPTTEVQNYLKNTTVLSVKSLTGSIFVAPTQNNLAEGIYPLARQLYVVNAQGYEGLGIGLASFLAGERGQRIILKSGLLPVRIPGRKIVVRHKF